ncbi:MAG: pantoate kinase [Candidatus Hydrothermarchaeales archaeon]
MKARAFAPGHITGFFAIFEHPEILETGSRGCGVVIDKGVHTEVALKDAEKNEVGVRVDDEICECPVTKTVVEEVLKLAESTYAVEVSHRLDAPMKYGFGTSASGALSTGLALNKALGLDLSLNQIGEIAHHSEVTNRTGLGDVIAECEGGVVIREREGAPGIGRVSKIPCGDYVVALLVGEELETKSVLNDAQKKEKINSIGEACLRMLLKTPTVENFLKLSKGFATETGMLEGEVKRTIGKLEERGIVSSMMMLGNSVFTITDVPEMVYEATEFKYVIAEIDYRGARLI